MESSLLAALFGIALAIGPVAVWIVRLRRSLLEQTRRLEDSVAAERHLQEKYRELFANASDMILQTNLDGRLVGSNRAAERVLAAPGTSLQGQFIEELFASDDMGWFFDLLDQTRTDGAVRVEREVESPDGQRLTIELNCRMLVDKGFETGLQAIGRDISARVKLQEELEKARQAAESNALAKSIFLANMSHEIRTPMNGILGMTRLLIDTELNEDQRDQAETIQHSAESLLTILNDILDLSRIEAGKLELVKESFDLPEVFEDVIDLLAPMARTKDREFLFDFASELPTHYVGDAGRLRQVVLNLVGNALKFTESGYIETRVSGIPNELYCDLLIEVEDSGIGMTTAQAARMFQPFEQAEPGTQRQFGGTGLGLALSKKIVTAMGGEIGVRSAPGVGSVFWVMLRMQVDSRQQTMLTTSLQGCKVSCAIAAPRLARTVNRWMVAHGAELTDDGPEIWISDLPEIPLGAARGAQRVLLSRDPSSAVGPMVAMLGFNAWLRQPLRQRDLIRTLENLRSRRGEAMLGPGSMRKSDPGSLATVSLAGLRVLLAEDNRVNQRVVTGVLKKTGCEFAVVDNGALALAELEREQYDVVLMDCHMPIMDGYTATRRIREREGAGARLPIIALTAGALAEDRDRCVQAGMDQFLAKPFRAEELTQLLAAVLAGGECLGGRVG